MARSSLPAHAHREHRFGDLFHSASLAEACQLAREEFRVVFVYVTGPNGRASPCLEKPTRADWEAIALLLREAVPIKLDLAGSAAQLQAYEIGQPPVILLLNPDGTERRRLPGDLSAGRLAEELAADLSGADSVARARQAVENSAGGDLFARERLADVLVRRGESAEALKEYLWCLEAGLGRDVPYTPATRRLVIKALAALAERYPPARRALQDYRTATEQALRAEPGNVKLARTLGRNLAELNRCLSDEARTLALYDELPTASRIRHSLFDGVLDQLVQKKRYDDVLDVLDPMRAFTQEARFAVVRSRQLGTDRGDVKERGTRAFAVARGAALVQALAATGRVQEAQELAEAVLRFDNAPQTGALLKRHAQRAGNQKLVSYIESKTAQPPDDRQPPISRSDSP